MKGKDSVSKVEEVLRALPLVKAKDTEIRMWAQKLAWGSVLHAVNDLPRSNLTSAAKARAEIKCLGDLAHQLAKHILTMHANSLDAIRKQKPRKDPLIMFDDLKDIVALQKKALADLSSLPSLVTAKGRPKKRSARDVAGIAGSAYRSLTKCEPKTRTKDGEAYGPFLDFLGRLLDVLDIDAKPEHLARAVSRKAKNPGR